MITLSGACMVVETRLSTDCGANEGTWFYLDNYSSLEELFADCAGWFMFEENPEYVFQDWENVPDCMIREDWLSPNFFIIRNGLKDIDELYQDMIWGWCESVGVDIANDDPHKILYDFECAICGLPVPKEYPEYGIEGCYSCDYCYDDYVEDESYFMVDHTGNSFEMFDDNYN